MILIILQIIQMEMIVGSSVYVNIFQIITECLYKYSITYAQLQEP